MKIQRIVFGIFPLILLLTACGAPASTSEATLPAPEVNTTQATATPFPQTTFPLTVTDCQQRTLTLDTPAQRIISLAPSNTEILFALGAQSQLVGRDGASDFPEAALQVTSIGDTYTGLNTELIVSLEPDFVLAAQITPLEQITQLEQIGITVYCLENPTDFDGLYANLITVGQMIGRVQEAITLIPSLQARVTAVDEALVEVTEEPTVFYELDASDPSAPWTSGAGTFIDMLISRSRGLNVAANLRGDYVQISIEELLVQNPQLILMGDAPYDVTPESVAERPGWSQLSAVQANKVVPLSLDLVNSISRPGPRLVDALEQLARILHPDLFD